MEIVDIKDYKNFRGKAGNLNKICDDFNVAKGFVITDKSFKEFVEINCIDLDDKREIIKDKILKGKFESDLIFDYFDKYNFDKVIIRSSASIEDGDNFSFSGQFDSFTNTNKDSLILNIKKCWISMFSENVSLYLSEKCVNKNFSFDVIVQEMIITDYSGIAFSVNPSTGKREVIVEITDSQCEDVVNGVANVERYHINQNFNLENKILSSILLEVRDSVNKLKSMFNKDIEIEFGFQKDKLYIFQVRAITKVYFSLTDYIKNEYWCCFKNNNWRLFDRSLWILGASKYKNKRINNDIVEDITLYYPNNQNQLRAFNGEQPPLDNVTINNHTEKDINKYIDERYKIAYSIKDLSLIIKKKINDNNFSGFNKSLKLLIHKNALIDSYEYLIGSLGNVFYDSMSLKTKDNISTWRNDEENGYFPIYDDVFQYVMKHFNINIEKNKFVMYIHVNELMSLCDGKLKVSDLFKRIEKREKNGFVLLNLNNKKYSNKVFTQDKIINVVHNRFEEIRNENINSEDCKGIKGTSTFKNGKVITGECVVIKDNNSSLFEYDLNNKILVCKVTTAKDIKVLKNVKCLIVDSGGILCHAAIFSREFNIPCLMGCEKASDYFNTGDILEYDVDSEKVVKI